MISESAMQVIDQFGQQEGARLERAAYQETVGQLRRVLSQLLAQERVREADLLALEGLLPGTLGLLADASGQSAEAFGAQLRAGLVLSYQLRKGLEGLRSVCG
ncbi:hypothetical protein WBJ53_04775 [Spirosoma sp. SC4-14]|uniref:hypothetical protein n=1 Tax=Spirosoma sp. SC4-14 TaxID=3128900 RepID=UPI0030D3C2A9